MASYQIISDSCCDFNLQQYQANNVLSVPLTVVYNGEAHNNFTDEASVKAFYDVLRTGVTATTSAVNPQGWEEAMEPVLAASGGGSDANIFGNKGIDAVNMGVGMGKVHTTSEEQNIAQMEMASQVCLELMKA